MRIALTKLIITENKLLKIAVSFTTVFLKAV